MSVLQVSGNTAGVSVLFYVICSDVDFTIQLHQIEVNSEPHVRSSVVNIVSVNKDV